MPKKPKTNLIKAYKRLRKQWLISPVTRVTPRKKIYKRGKIKQETRKIIKGEET